jgi:serine/threonine-protein kinase
MASVPPVVAGKYRIEQLLARGGMGAVYRARDIRLDRVLALKVLPADVLGNAAVQQRFLRDTQTLMRLHHPAIVTVCDSGILEDGRGFLAMELVDGEDLRTVLHREGRLDARRATAILAAVCGAVETAHREGLLHGDLKPENILLTDGDVRVKVLDFGLGHVLEDRLTAPPAASPVATAQVIVGTPAYMAPEQLRGRPLDGRADVFSLGVIAFEMLTGELPFGRGPLADVVLAHARGVPPMTDTPPALARAVRAALEQEADRRPASPRALAHLFAAAAAF